MTRVRYDAAVPAPRPIHDVLQEVARVRSALEIDLVLAGAAVDEGAGDYAGELLAAARRRVARLPGDVARRLTTEQNPAR